MNIFAKYIRIKIFWLVGCFGFNGPLRQYFSLYRAVSKYAAMIIFFLYLLANHTHTSDQNSQYGVLYFYYYNVTAANPKQK